MQGLVCKGVGSFYTLLGSDGEEYVCKARGRFRKDGVSPVPGDRVEFEPGAEGMEGRITEILPRKNLLDRPAAANLDKLFIVLSATVPKPDLLLVDKLIVQCFLLSIEPVLLINKIDDKGAAESLSAFKADYKAFQTIFVSAKTGEGLEPLKDALRGCVSCFTGQSAVGKSSLLNALLSLSLPVGRLSRKTEQGRHTTRHAVLIPAFSGAVLDTPGFSLLEMQSLEPCELSTQYPEMREARLGCRFPECLHVREPDCAVKALVQDGCITPDRYARYCVLLEELKEMKKNRYN